MSVYQANAAALGALAQPTRDAGAGLLDAATKMHHAIYGLDWQGQGRSATETRAERELAYDRTTEAGFDALADAYANGCKTMQPMIERLHSQGKGLEADYFDVSEDWIVTDKFDYQAGRAAMIHHGASEQAATDRMNQLASERGHEAASATATLQRLADQLGNADHDTAHTILTAANQLDPHHRAAPHHIQTVDHHNFKQDPPPPPGPPGNPFAGWTDEQMAQVANEIAHGHAWPEHSNDFPKGWTERDLARWIYDTMKNPATQTGTSVESGGVVLFRDGKVVFVDPKGPDFGTTYAPRPLRGSTWQTPEEYFKRHTRELQPVPPPVAGKLPPLNPNEMAPPPAASVSPPRVEEGVPAAEPRPEPPAGRGGSAGPEGGAGSPGPRTGGAGPNAGGGGILGGGGGGGGNLRPFPLPGRPPI